jgi:VanZ family protein
VTRPGSQFLAGPLVRLWGPVVVATVAIFVVSAQPDPPLPSVITDKQGHSAGYAVLAALVTRALVGGLGGQVHVAQAARSIALTTTYGASDEWHQSFVPGREADVADVWADAVGACVGTALCWAWGIIRPRSDV